MKKYIIMIVLIFITIILINRLYDYGNNHIECENTNNQILKI